MVFSVDVLPIIYSVKLIDSFLPLNGGAAATDVLVCEHVVAVERVASRLFQDGKRGHQRVSVLRRSQNVAAVAVVAIHRAPAL